MSSTPNSKKQFEKLIEQVSTNLKLLNGTPSPMSRFPASPTLTKIRSISYKPPLFSPEKLTPKKLYFNNKPVQGSEK